MRNYVTLFKPVFMETASVKEVKRVIPAYETMLLSILYCIIERYKMDTNYHFINTKIDTISGKELSEIVNGIDLFGKETIYPWIQGRGLEALGTHYEWIERLSSIDSDERSYFLTNIKKMVSEVVVKMEEFQEKNNGRLFFWMDKTGNAFLLDKNSKKSVITLCPAQISFSDLFYVKGLLKSAKILGEITLEEKAQAYYHDIMKGFSENAFETDQQQLDPQNTVGVVKARHWHGPEMIAIGMCALFAEMYNDTKYVNDGIYFIEYILEHYVNYDNKFVDLKPYDFPEFIDDNGAPYAENGSIISDTGHVLEFVGLSLKFVKAIEAKPFLTRKHRNFIKKCKAIMPEILFHNFKLGYNKDKGIFKCISLNTGAPVNSNMPWWNLPETIRAAIEVYEIVREERKNAALDVVLKCSNAFLKNYVNPRVYLMAYQSCDRNGQPIRVVPATPDADPGYHTGLSFIDVLKIFRRLQC